MKRSDELRSTKAQKVQRMQELADGAKGRKLTDEERSEFDTLKSEVQALNAEIEDAVFLEEEQRQAAESEAHQRGSKPPALKTGGEQAEARKLASEYSILRAMQKVAKGHKLDGVEGEMHEQAIEEARSIGLSTSGNVQIPGMIARDMTAGTDTQGGHTIAEELRGPINILDPRLMVESMGATVLRGLTSNLKFYRGDADAEAEWEGENDANAETSPTFDSFTMTPHRLGAFTDISKQVMLQSSMDMEAYVRRRLNLAVQRKLDSTAINGSGSGDIPRGILNTSGIGDVAGGTNGATPDWADIVDLETEIAVDNADLGRLGYLTTPGIRGYLKKTLLDAGSGQMIWPVGSTEINGYRIGVTTQVPSDLTKGTASGIAHAILFGNWEDLMIGQWGGFDLVVDPYSRSKESMVVLVINSWWDIAVRHPESFAAMKDALTS